MTAASPFQPKIIGFLCNWCCYGGADLCGVSRFQYPPYLRVIRVMCSGRVDLKFIVRAFQNGADGVFVGGCHLNDCHYNPEGNYDALMLSKICKKLLADIGINPERFRLEWVSAGEGIRFAEIMNAFSKRVKELGPLGTSESLDKEDLQFRLASVARLIPYIKLVERKKLRLPVRTEAACDEFFNGPTLDWVYDRFIAGKLITTQILQLLRKEPLPGEKIAEALNLSLSDVAQHMKSSARQGYVRYHADSQCYALN